MIVIWTPEAEQDRADIWDYITADNPVAAVKMDNHFSESAIRLKSSQQWAFPARSPVLVSYSLIIIIVWCMKSARMKILYGYCPWLVHFVNGRLFNTPFTLLA